MMVNCPKCGFSQPEDQYCANCGVDMLAYRPARSPLPVRIIKSVPFQLSALALVIVGGFMVIQERNRAALEDRSAQIENAPDVRLIQRRQEASAPAANSQAASEAASTETHSPATDSQLQPPVTAAAEPPSTTIASTESTGPEADAPAAAPTPPPTTSTAPPAAGAERAALPQNIQISFVELSRFALNDLASDGRNTSGYGSFVTGSVANGAARLKQLQQLQSQATKTLEAPTKQGLRANQPVLLFRGMRDETSGQDLGLTVQVTPVAIDESGTQVQIEILKVLREPGANPPISEQTFQDQLTIPRGAVAFVAGVLPRRASLPEDDARLYATNPVLNVLNSPSFQNGSSEFVILIEPR